MLYTAKTKLALQISFDAHREQLDKSGMPYVYHPYHLAEQMPDEDCTVAALLHDVAEDGGGTLAELASCGFGEDVLRALRLLTRTEGMSYTDYILSLRENRIARTVKLADLRHNSDLSRLETVTERDLRRTEKYRAAAALLEETED